MTSTMLQIIRKSDGKSWTLDKLTEFVSQHNSANTGCLPAYLILHPDGQAAVSFFDLYSPKEVTWILEPERYAVSVIPDTCIRKEDVKAVYERIERRAFYSKDYKCEVLHMQAVRSAFSRIMET